MTIADAAEALADLERMVAGVKGEGPPESTFARALETLKALSRKEGISMAIVGGLAAIHHGYQRFTKDIDVVIQSKYLDVLTRVAPQYGIKVIWKDPQGWHKLQCEGVPIDVVPEGRKPRPDAPTAIPTPEQLGVPEGADYAAIAGWMETKLGSYRVQDRADVVQVIKVASPATLTTIREHLGKVHTTYLQRFDELLETARQEQEQERERGGGREQRLELLGLIWDSLPDAPPFTPPDWHLRELERRIALADADPGAAKPWETVRARLSRK